MMPPTRTPQFSFEKRKFCAMKFGEWEDYAWIKQQYRERFGAPVPGKRKSKSCLFLPIFSLFVYEDEMTLRHKKEKKKTQEN